MMARTIHVSLLGGVVSLRHVISCYTALQKAKTDTIFFGNPVARNCRKHILKAGRKCVPRMIAFVLPTGYTFNLDGSTLYLSLASVYTAQAAGIPLSIGEQAIMILTLILSSKGIASVARASLVILGNSRIIWASPLANHGNVGY